MKAFHEVRTYHSDFMVWQSAYRDISFVAHWHQEIELMYVRSGTAHMSINEHTFTARKGDLVIVDTGDFHYCDSRNARNELDFLIFDPSVVSSFYHHSNFAHPPDLKQITKRMGSGRRCGNSLRLHPPGT